MSRTYRKGYIANHTANEIRRVWDWRAREKDSDYAVPRGSYIDYYVAIGTTNYKRLIADKTRDGARCHRSGPPQDFVRCFNKTHRARFREEANRFLTGTVEDISFDERHRHSATYAWW